MATTDPARVLHDPARLAALCETRLPDTPPEEAFDRLTRLAARLLGAPGATVSLVDAERQFFKSQVGLPAPLAEARQTPLDESICAHVVVGGAPLVIGDTAADPRFQLHPAWLKWGVRAYAGVPVATAEGQVLGTLCVIDGVPRTWGDADLEVLRELGAMAAAEVERRRAESRTSAALRETEGWFRSLVEQTIAGIYVFQGDRFRYVNPRFAEAFGMVPEDFYTPESIRRVIHPDDLARVMENIRRRLDGEVSTLRYAFRGVRADGRELFLEVHGSRAELEGRPALVGIGIDVTERVLAEREREAAVAARDRFYAMASHELRTPISTVMLYNDLLLSDVCGALSEAQRESVERSQKSARHLLELINDLLDLSKLEAGKMEARVQEVELAALVEGVRGDVAALAAEHGCAVSLEVARRPLVVSGDERRIRQILLNLLSNAVKFGRGRPIEVWCGPWEGGVAVSVTDHGAGIAAGDLSRIFEDFVQLGDESEVGTGLGLPIARRLASLLGGRLEVTSAPGVGSTFRLFLPELLDEGAGGGEDDGGIPEVIY